MIAQDEGSHEDPEFECFRDGCLCQGLGKTGPGQSADERRAAAELSLVCWRGSLVLQQHTPR